MSHKVDLDAFPMVWNTEKFIYYEIPKCASTTIKDTLNLNVASSFRISDWPKDYGKFSFSFVRNPYSRAISNFYMCKKFPEKCYSSTLPSKAATSFEEWVLDLKNHPNHHWEKQVRFLPQLCNVDFLGIADKLYFEQEFRELLQNPIFKDIEFDPKSFPHHNSLISRYDFLYDLLSRKIIDMIKEQYPEDLLLYQSVMERRFPEKFEEYKSKRLFI